MKTKINTEYVSALEEQNKISSSWRAFQNFLECTEPKLLEMFKDPVNIITQVLSEQRDLYK
jgi:hypothetical protein